MARPVAYSLPAILVAGTILFGLLPISAAQAGCVGARGWTFTGPTALAVHKDKAKERARRKWRTRVSLKYGYKFNNWSSAKNSDYSCGRKHGTWRCKAKGNPCTLQQAH